MRSSMGIMATPQHPPRIGLGAGPGGTQDMMSAEVRSVVSKLRAERQATAQQGTADAAAVGENVGSGCTAAWHVELAIASVSRACASDASLLMLHMHIHAHVHWCITNVSSARACALVYQECIISTCMWGYGGHIPWAAKSCTHD